MAVAVVLVPLVVSFALRTTLWPFSHYPMFAQVEEQPEAVQVFVVDHAGQRRWRAVDRYAARRVSGELLAVWPNVVPGRFSAGPGETVRLRRARAAVTEEGAKIETLGWVDGP